MSESVEVFEITDTSLAVDTITDLKDKEIPAETPAIIETTTTTKRQLENDGDEVDERSAKKVCTEVEGEEVNEVEDILEESKVEEAENSNVLEKNIVEEALEKSSETIDDEDPWEEIPSQEIEDEEVPSQEIEDEEEDIAEESFECQEEEEEEGTSDDDEELMARVMQTTKSTFQMSNDEPIALDDSDEEEEEKLNDSKYKSDSSEFSVDNNVLEESDEEAEDLREILRSKAIQIAQKPTLLMAKKIVKKSRKIFTKKKFERVKRNFGEGSKGVEKKVEEKIVAVEKQDEPMEVTEEEIPAQEPQKSLPQDEPVPSPPPEEKKPEKSPPVIEETKATPPENNDKPPEPEKINPPPENPPTETSINLLAEIQNSPIDEIFNRYVLKSNENSPTLDEFNEELFYCLQQNKLEIEKATQLWNEKIHVKYKIRELMETIRRHRAVMEIETFGKIPENSNSNHPVISSKSSTTTNSEADHFEKQLRMSSDSVSRLIQDVRASMLKREEKQDESFNSVQQGRQGQIIDVQSIINDFRQKNPQEIPRRGRRMKNSFGFDNQHDFSSNGHEMKAGASSSGGYPEVSLHPVQNLYKSIGNAQSSPHFSGQKSSLLQSILTKQSTKSPASSFHTNHSLPSTSTLARLLTAPERSIHGTPKQSAPSRQSKSHNGEITITPIGLNNNSRNKDFSMEDEENSMEPPLVIDESEDFDASSKNVTDLLCQGCKKNKAFFMCAGCSRQWYCSKECQEMAWDEHAEDCMI